MPWTVLNCDHIDFNSAGDDNLRVSPNDTWESASVSVIVMSEHDHWLMVRTERNPRPAVWRAIKESWIVACDEQSMTMLLQYTSSDETTKTILKLRFGSLREFWTFAAHSTFARVHAQSMGWAGAGYTSSEQGALGDHIAASGM